VVQDRGVFARNNRIPISDILREEHEPESESLQDPFLHNDDLGGPFVRMQYFDNQVEDSILGSQQEGSLNDESEQFYLDSDFSEVLSHSQSELRHHQPVNSTLAFIILQNF